MLGLTLRRLFGHEPERPVPRDPHLPAEYWAKWSGYAAREGRKGARSKETRHPDRKRRVAARVDLELRRLSLRMVSLYSGGYALAEVAAAWRAERALKHELDPEFRQAHPERPYGLFGWTVQDQYEAMLGDLALTACLIPEPGALAADIARSRPAGHDRLFDLVARTVDPGRTPAPALAFPKRYAKLLAAVEAPRDRQAPLLLEALRTWKRRLPHQGKPPPGATTVVDGAYQGWWCWEAALVVRVLGIDDRDVRAHPNYPADVVAWRPPAPGS